MYASGALLLWKDSYQVPMELETGLSRRAGLDVRENKKHPPAAAVDPLYLGIPNRSLVTMSIVLFCSCRSLRSYSALKAPKDDVFSSLVKSVTCFN